MYRILFIALITVLTATQALAVVTMNETEFRDKVYACWLGKNIGGTLGMPFEGSQSPHALTFFDPVPLTPAANDDLDLQLLWLKAMQERGINVNARILGEYWLKYVPVDWNEYGIGKANMRLGFPPPISGQVRNRQWRNSNGAWIRSEIWACVAPGNPALAARYAWNDACVDHGGMEGTYAELFTATLESAAFVEKDRDKLLQIALSYIPTNCQVSKAVRTAMACKTRGLDLVAARAEVIKVTETTGWFQAPRNVAFTMLGWLYGDGDFGKSICAAVNCGDDTDCTGATLGSLLGILNGGAGISERWRKPVGTSIQNVAIAGFEAPKNLDVLTDQTVEMAKRVIRETRSPFVVSDKPTDMRDAAKLKLINLAAAKQIWSLSPFAVYEQTATTKANLDFLDEPFVAAGVPTKVKLNIENLTTSSLQITPQLNASDGLSLSGLPHRIDLGPRQKTTIDLTVTLAQGFGSILNGQLTLEGSGDQPGTLPFAVGTRVEANKNDVALASKGAKATADSEYEAEKGCIAKGIDGILGDIDAYEGKRWHSALTPMPHWFMVELPKVRKINRIVVTFADPQGYPTDFVCEASTDGVSWRAVAQETDYKEIHRYDKAIAPTEMRFFRFTIRRAANPAYPNAAQLSEVELIPAD